MEASASQPRKLILGRSDVGYAIGIAVLIAVAVFLNSALTQPYGTFALCGFASGGFVFVLAWIRARVFRVPVARKVPKVTARKVPKP